ncbi:AAA family ATPase [Mesonia sp. MT50]|uniref:AAA family ATPase n=1 Tax=Mesonia profundi TaxID=3070998 RepID=A0ABU1A3X5_9FLAO|nr:AAA family ATPase [Mesonia profundi]MDQ7918409.1 AAA family ATPase [Mesonia profundi]
MNIQGFGIKNFRSFDSDGIYLDGLKKINIIIGKNNCGKSNVLRFLQTLHSNLSDLNKFPNDIKNQHRRNGQSTILNLKVKGDNLPHNKDKFRRANGFDYNNFLEQFHNFDVNLNSQSINLPEQLNDLEWQQLIPFQSAYAQASAQQLLSKINESWKQSIIQKVKSTFKDLIYIPHLRVIKEGHQFGDSNSSINGSNIISKMFEMQNPEIGNENARDKFNLIQTFVRDLINKPDLEIEIPHTKEEIVLTIDGNRLPLDSFGTGIHQLVMLCSTLVIHDNSIVCIEEPEIHLHPELQRKFIKFLGKTKNIYFLTTHSNIFLDSRLNTSIYHVQNDGIKSTISHANRTTRTFSILNDLGYHSSDILQANGIIWVEGPSDRTFIIKWINLIDSTLIEGLHFSIMFYGGRLLSHISFQNEKLITDLIPLLKLNRNAYVLMDRDGFSSKTKINLTKRRIKEEIGDRNCWITKGREIENYLTEKTIQNWLEVDKVKINPDLKLEEIVSKIHKNKYNTAKTKYSKEIIKHITIEDLDILDLKLKVKQLTNRINDWNA